MHKLLEKKAISQVSNLNSITTNALNTLTV